MSKKQLSFEEQELYLVESGWEEKKGKWRHPTVHDPWPLEDAFRLQRGADRGARGPCFEELREWARARSRAS